MSRRSFYDTNKTRMIFWRKVVVHPFLWSRHDFNPPMYPFEQVLKSSGFRLNIWNWLCCSSSIHVIISATDTSNALCKIHLQKNDIFTVAPTTVWHDCLSRMSLREMPKLYILTYYLYFVYREETFVFHYWYVSEWDWLFNVTFNDISVMWRHIYRCAGGPKRKKLGLRSGSHAIDTNTTANIFTVILRNRQISVVFTDAHENTEDLFSSSPPSVPNQKKLVVGFLQ